MPQVVGNPELNVYKRSMYPLYFTALPTGNEDVSNVGVTNWFKKMPEPVF